MENLMNALFGNHFVVTPDIGTLYGIKEKSTGKVVVENFHMPLMFNSLDDSYDVMNEIDPDLEDYKVVSFTFGDFIEQGYSRISLNGVMGVII